MFDCFVAADFHAGADANAVLAEKTLHGDACARARFAHQEDFIVQPFERDVVCVGERMIGRRDDHQRVGFETHRIETQFVRRLAHDHQLNAVVHELLEQRFAVGDIEADGDFGVTLGEGAEQFGDEVIGGGGDRDFQAAAGQALEPIDHTLQFVELLDDAATILIHIPPGFGQCDLLAQLLEQWQSHGPFQLFDLHGYGRLSQVQFSGRASVTEEPGDGFEDLDLTKSDVHGVFTIYKVNLIVTIINTEFHLWFDVGMVCPIVTATEVWLHTEGSSAGSGDRYPGRTAPRLNAIDFI